MYTYFKRRGKSTKGVEKLRTLHEAGVERLKLMGVDNYNKYKEQTHTHAGAHTHTCKYP